MLCVTFTYYSCKKNDNKPTPTPAPQPQPAGQYYIKAKLNGELTSYSMNTKGIIEGKAIGGVGIAVAQVFCNKRLVFQIHGLKI